MDAELSVLNLPDCSSLANVQASALRRQNGHDTYAHESPASACTHA